MYRIEGDGTHNNTLVWKDGEQIPYTRCIFKITHDTCEADVDGISGKLDRVVISAVYLIISDGDFTNSRIIFQDEMLRGVQGLVVKIEKDQHPMMAVDAVLLPHIIETPKETKD